MIGVGVVPSHAFAKGKHYEVQSSLTVRTPGSSP
jgi:hypothetical protein